MARKVIYVIVGLLVLVAIGVAYLWSSLDSIVAAAIEKYGSQATQTEVAVKSVKIALTEGEASMGGLTVANPQGFTSPHAFSLGEIEVGIDTSTVMSSPILIRKIHIKEPHAFYEINESGQVNLNQIKNNLTASKGQQAEPTEGQASAVKLIINELVIEGGQVDGQIAALKDGDFNTELPRLHMTDLGAKTNGATPDDIAREIVTILAQRAVRSAARMGVERYVGKSTEELKEELKGKAKGALKDKGGEMIKDLLNR